MRFTAESELLGDNNQGNSKNCTVGGNQRKENSERRIKRRAHLLENNLNHLHESRNHKDESNRLQEFNVKRSEHVGLKQIGHKCRESNHEADRTGHSHCCGKFIGNSEERADSEELRKQDIIYKYR